MHKRLHKSDTSRSAKIWPQDTSAECLEAARPDTASLWMTQNRGTPLESWSEPTLHIKDTAHRNAAAIREFAAIMADAAAILTAWEANAPEWITGREFRKIEKGEELQVGDLVYTTKYRHSDCNKISRVTAKTAFTEAGRKWPRTVDNFRWAEIGNGPHYGSDVALRIIHEPTPKA